MSLNIKENGYQQPMLLDASPSVRVQRKKGPGKWSTEFWMLLPSLVLLAMISIFPLMYMIYASMMDFTLSFDEPAFNGLKNWKNVLTSDTFWASWGRTAVYALCGLSLEMAVGVGMALLIHQLPRARNAILTLWMIPLFVAPVVVGLLGRFMLNSTYGLYAWLFRLIGVETEILGDVSTALPAIILMDVWEWSPLITIIVYAGLQSLQEEVLEAAEVDGAGYWRKLIHVVFPLISRTVVLALLIRMMDIFRFVDTIKIATEGGPADSTKIIGFHLMEVAFRFQDLGSAAALGLTMLFVTIILGQLFVRFMRKGEA